MNRMAAATQLSIAKHLNLSKATVSRILGGNTSHDDVTRARVLTLAAQLGYRHLRPTVRQRVDTRKKKTLALGVVFEVNTHPVSELPIVAMRALRGISSAARMENAAIEVFHVSAGVKYGDTMIQFDSLQDKRISGLILAGGFNLEAIREVTRKVYCVRLNNRESNVDVDCVGQNDADAVEQLFMHLDGLGHRRIGFLREAEENWPARARQAGYFSAMAQRGLEHELNIVVRPPNVASMEERHRCYQDLTAQIKRGVSAWICNHDDVGYDLVDWLHANGLRVPRDVSVCAFDHLPVRNRKLPKLTSIDWPFEDIGTAALRRLLRRLQEPAASPVYMQMNGHLVEGRSTGPYNGVIKHKAI